VRDDQRAKLSHRNLKNIQVARKNGRSKPTVVEDRTPATLRFDYDQRREAMLRDQLVAIAPVGSEVSANALRAGHQQVDEVVDHDRDFGTIDRLEQNRPTASHGPLTLLREHFRTLAQATVDSSNGAPGYRAYALGYYSAFLLDPDGNDVEALYRDVGNIGHDATATLH
jgi:hypothetical protein